MKGCIDTEGAVPSTHVGESWQCPLAQGSSCATVAEADPAVPAAARTAVLFGDPLPAAHRQPDGTGVGNRRYQGEACADDCEPLAWLATLFRAVASDDSARVPPEAPTTGQDGTVPSSASGPAIADDASLRVPEVLGRTWIAPFVDADGIYREARWVRVVLERPAGSSRDRAPAGAVRGPRSPRVLVPAVGARCGPMQNSRPVSRSVPNGWPTKNWPLGHTWCERPRSSHRWGWHGLPAVRRCFHQPRRSPAWPWRPCQAHRRDQSGRHRHGREHLPPKLKGQLAPGGVGRVAPSGNDCAFRNAGIAAT